MATTEQIESILEKMENSHPKNFFKKVNDTQAGIGAVLRLLSESGEEVTAGKISEELDVSTARVAVLIKKMASKGLVIKEQSLRDGRVTVVKLTEYGKDTVCKIREDLYQQIGQVIDNVGEERLLEFIAISNEIREVMKGPNIKF